MIQIPTAVGLLLCQQVIVEEKTHNLTLVNCLGRIRVKSFPTAPQKFTAFALLTDGQGEME